MGSMPTSGEGKNATASNSNIFMPREQILATTMCVKYFNVAMVVNETTECPSASLYPARAMFKTILQQHAT